MFLHKPSLAFCRLSSGDDDPLRGIVGRDWEDLFPLRWTRKSRTAVMSKHPPRSIDKEVY